MGAALVMASSGRRMSGWWRGFQQPALALEFGVAAPPAAATARAESGLRALLTLPELPDGPADSAPLHLVHLVLLATQQLLRSTGLVLAPQLHLALAPRASEAVDGDVRAMIVTVSAALPVVSLEATRETLAMMLDVTNRLLGGADPATLAPLLAPMQERLRRQSYSGQNTPMLLQAALDLDLPLERLSLQLVRIGFGARQRLFASTMTDQTPALATVLARDKQATARMLRRIGLPGAHNERVADADAALRLARRWGYPVVVKPLDLDGGLGVAADLRDEQTLRDAFAEARRHSPRVLLERHVEGIGHRLTVAHGRVLKVTAKAPWGVHGDGQTIIAELAAAEPPDGATRLDAEALGLLRQQGLDAHSVLPAGDFIALRRRNNAAAGGRTTPLALSAVHPDNLELALRAADALLLDTAGVDLIVADISRSWTTQPAVICEVNAQPQTDRRTLAAWLAEAVGAQGVRIPVRLMLIAGPRMPTPGTIGGWAQQFGATAWASPHGACIDGVALAGTAGDGRSAVQAALLSRRVTSALLVLPPAAVLHHGLPVDRLQGCWLAEDAPGIDALLERYNADTEPALHADAGSDSVLVALLREGIGPHLRRL